MAGTGDDRVAAAWPGTHEPTTADLAARPSVVEALEDGRRALVGAIAEITRRHRFNEAAGAHEIVEMLESEGSLADPHHEHVGGKPTMTMTPVPECCAGGPKPVEERARDAYEMARNDTLNHGEAFIEALMWLAQEDYDDEHLGRAVRELLTIDDDD